MFGMGGTEIIVILVVALLFLGPEKLPETAAKISKGIRELRKQTRELTNVVENDTEIGGAIRDLKGALRGDEPRPRITPRPAKKPAPEVADAATQAIAEPAVAAAAVDAATSPAPEAAAGSAPEASPAPDSAPAGPRMPETVGEEAPPASDEPDDDADLAALVKPAGGTVAKGDAG